MILSNTEIIRALSEGRIKITPTPPPPFDTTAVDLHLGCVINIPKNLCVSFDPSQGKISDTFMNVFSTHTLEPKGVFTLDPGKFILACTEETIDLPIRTDTDEVCIAARVEGKSSLARCGLLIHFTAPTIHAGFTGKIALEVINLGPYPILLRQSMPICQLIFELVLGKPNMNPSQFHGQQTPAGV